MLVVVMRFIVIMLVLVVVVLVVVMIVIAICFEIHTAFHGYFISCASAAVECEHALGLLHQYFHCLGDLCFLFVCARIVFESDQVVPWRFQFHKYRAIVQCHVQNRGAMFMTVEVSFSIRGGNCGDACHRNGKRYL